MKLTEHGKDRMTERIGLSKSIIEKHAEKALLYGIKQENATGHLKKYFAELYFSYRTANNTRIYNRYVFIFNNDKLITVFGLPSNLHKLEDKIKKKLKNSFHV